MKKYIIFQNKIKEIKTVQQVLNGISISAQNNFFKILPKLQATRTMLAHSLHLYEQMGWKKITSNTKKDHVVLFFATHSGLCGGLNQSLERLVCQTIPKPIHWVIVSGKKETFLKEGAIEINITENVIVQDLEKLLQNIHSYQNRNMGVWIAYHHFINYMNTQPTCSPFWLSKAIEEREYRAYTEPSKEFVQQKIRNYYELVWMLYTITEHIACEYSSRARNMKNATDNAQELIKEMESTARQERKNYITQELNEMTNAFIE